MQCLPPPPSARIPSGRSLQTLRSLVPVAGLSLAGNHGHEIAVVGEATVLELKNSSGIRAFSAACEGAELEAAGCWLEDKGASLTIHHREAADQARRAEGSAGYQPLQERAVDGESGFHLTPSRRLPQLAAARRGVPVERARAAGGRSRAAGATGALHPRGAPCRRECRQ